jgi:hypothetical protein
VTTSQAARFSGVSKFQLAVLEGLVDMEQMRIDDGEQGDSTLAFMCTSQSGFKRLNSFMAPSAPSVSSQLTHWLSESG